MVRAALSVVHPYHCWFCLVILPFIQTWSLREPRILSTITTILKRTSYQIAHFWQLIIQSLLWYMLSAWDLGFKIFKMSGRFRASHDMKPVFENVVWQLGERNGQTLKGIAENMPIRILVITNFEFVYQCGQGIYFFNLHKCSEIFRVANMRSISVPEKSINFPYMVNFSINIIYIWVFIWSQKT